MTCTTVESDLSTISKLSTNCDSINYRTTVGKPKALAQLCKLEDDDEHMQKKDFSELKRRLEMGEDPNQMYYGLTPLHFASAYGLYEFIILLLLYGADHLIESFGTCSIPEEIAFNYNQVACHFLLVTYDAIGKDALLLDKKEVIEAGKLAMFIRDKQTTLTTLTARLHELSKK